jgi:hypothetical protein
LIPEFGPMYGPNRTSEAKQAARIASRIPSGSLVLADAGFGIFSVAWAMIGADHEVLFRLTKSRFKALSRRAEVIDETAQHTRYRLRRTPSAKDRQTNPELPPRRAWSFAQGGVGGRRDLYLVTTLSPASWQLSITAIVTMSSTTFET